MKKRYWFFTALAAAVVLAIVGGLTGWAIHVEEAYIQNESGVIGGNVTQGDNFTVYANVTASDGENVASVWVKFWDFIGGIFESDEFNLTYNESSGLYEGVISSDSPPFPNVTSFETYNFTVNATGDLGNSSSLDGNLTILSESIIPLYEGWNMIGFNLHNQTEEEENITLELSSGWNLIGYSSNISAAQQSDILINGSDLFTAVQNGTIQNQFTFYDAENEKYQYVPMQRGDLEASRGYWIYANRSVNMTLNIAGGTRIGETFPLNQLVFRNETSGIEYAFSDVFKPTFMGGWGEEWIQVYEDGDFRAVESAENVSAWEGYFFEIPAGNISVIRRTLA